MSRESKSDGPDESKLNRDFSTLWEAMVGDDRPLMYQGRPPKKSVERAPAVGDLLAMIGDGSAINGDPFWIAKLHELDEQHMWVVYYASFKGRKEVFNGTYKALHDPDDKTKMWIEKLPRTTTILDWGFTLTAQGLLRKSTLKNIAKDVRIVWSG